MRTPAKSREGAFTLPTFALPTRSMMATSATWPMAVGLLWSIIAWLIGSPSSGVLGLACGIIVAVASIASDWLVKPWKKRTSIQWMTLWMVHEACRLTCSLGLVILLYFAFSPAPAALLLPYLVCVLAGLTATTRIWTAGMRKEQVPGE